MDNRRYGCDLCGQTFTRICGLNRHRREQHGRLPYRRCPFCDNIFRRREHLYRHLRTACRFVYADENEHQPGGNDDQPLHIEGGNDDQPLEAAYQPRVLAIEGGNYDQPLPQAAHQDHLQDRPAEAVDIFAVRRPPPLTPRPLVPPELHAMVHPTPRRVVPQVIDLVEEPEIIELD